MRNSSLPQSQAHVEATRNPRHIPATAVTAVVLIGLILAVTSGSVLWGQGETKSGGNRQSEPASGETGEADAVLREAHARLLSHRTIRADIVEVAQLTEPPLRMTGRYVSAGVKLRLTYDVKLPGGVEGSLLEVCDGERLWSLMQLPGSQRVTRRDVRQILAAAERAKTRPDRAAAVDLALGGLPALLTSLQRSMQFSAPKRERQGDADVVILTGRWRKELAEQLGGDPSDPRFPPHVPDGVRVVFAADSLFPLRLTYWKRDEGRMRSLLDLQFLNVALDRPVEEREFDFTPPEDSEPEDVTRQYLDQLFPSQAQDASATGSGAKP